MKTKFAFAAVTVALVAAAPLQAQREGLDLSPFAKAGQTVSPFFEGWYQNADGTYTLSFGYFNRNLEQVVEIPLGPDNFIEPAQYDGVQPAVFNSVNYGGYGGRRERGVFAVTVPADFGSQEVVWTLRMDGKELVVPGRIGSSAYELSRANMAMGSAPPSVRFDQNGEAGFGVEGLESAHVLDAKVNQPLSVVFWAGDERSIRDEPVALRATWTKYQGPGDVLFGEEQQEIEAGSADPTINEVTFSDAGEYLLRVKIDNHAAPDSSPGDQCCWTNGYVRVNVTE